LVFKTEKANRFLNSFQNYCFQKYQNYQEYETNSSRSKKYSEGILLPSFIKETNIANGFE